MVFCLGTAGKQCLNKIPKRGKIHELVQGKTSASLIWETRNFAAPQYAYRIVCSDGVAEQTL